MKLIKQLILFFVFVALFSLVAALATRHSATFDTSLLLARNIDDLREEITTQWSQCDGWDNTLYDSQVSMLAQSRAAGIIDDEARNILLDRVNQEAWQSCVKAMDKQWSLTDCDEAIVNHNHSGLETIMLRRPAISAIPEVKTALDTHRLYRNILAFNRASLDLNPRFNFERNYPANDFNRHAANALARKNNLTSDPHYPRLSHISSIKPIQSVSDRLQQSRNRYLDKLVAQIAEAYSRQVRDISADDSQRHAELKTNFMLLRSNLFNNGYTSVNSRLSEVQNTIF